MTQILLAVGVLTGLGLAFGALLSLAGKLFQVEIDPRVEAVRQCLAGANCGACGFPGCDACAEAIVKGEAAPNCCAPAGVSGAQAIGKVMGVDAVQVTPMIARVLCNGTIGVANDRYTYDGYTSCRVAAGIAGGPKECRFACIGLGDCIEHCAFGAISIRGGIARIDEKRCMACGACVGACPRSVIQMLPISSNVIVQCRNTDPAKKARDACMRACIGCGRCVKACKVGAIEVVDGVAKIDYTKCTLCGDCAQICPCKCIKVI
ncbi:MAG: RnfABCDGE type electron transport complex subunit B [Clostridia bacterium]